MKQQPQPQQQGRRSARRSRGQGHDPVIAPGFGTKTDIEKLSHDLSVGSDATLPSAAVEVCVCVCVCSCEMVVGWLCFALFCMLFCG